MDTLQNPPLVVRLLQDIGKLPASIAIQFPYQVVTSLIFHRLAIPIAAFNVEPDLILDDDDMEQLASKSGTWLEQALAA